VSSETPEPRRASLELFTFKRGLLAAAGHDLCLVLGELQIELASGQVRARFALGSLRVLGAMRRGTLARDEPSEGDRRTILDTARREILNTDRHPHATLTGTLRPSAGRAELSGELELHGVKKPITLDMSLAGASVALVVRTEIVPSRWGIEPYSALGGALKLQDRVQVVLTLDVDAALLAAPATGRARWAAG
jgi:hypothetical protein